MAHAQFLVGDLYEYGGVGSGATQAVGGGVFRPNPRKALSWYARAAMRGHPLAALSCGEMLAQSGGHCARPAGVNFEVLGAHQAKRIAKAGGAVAVQRDGWRLAYFTEAAASSSSVEETARRARTYFEEVLQLTGRNPPGGRETLQWEKHWEGKRASQQLAQQARLSAQLPPLGGTAKASSRSLPGGRASSVPTPVTGGGGPADWPRYRCRAFLGLAMLAQVRACTPLTPRFIAHTHTPSKGAANARARAARFCSLFFALDFVLFLRLSHGPYVPVLGLPAL
jgi:hypothetical protein